MRETIKLSSDMKKNVTMLNSLSFFEFFFTKKQNIQLLHKKENQIIISLFIRPLLLSMLSLSTELFTCSRV